MFVQPVEGIQFEITAKRVGRQEHIVKLPVLQQCLHLTSVVGDFGAQTAELVVNQFQCSSQTTELPQIFILNLDIGFVADVVFNSGPYVLQGRAHLQFEAGTTFFQTADVMKGVVAKGVKFMQFAFVHALFPVDVEDAFGDSCNFVHLVSVESDDAQSYKVGHIINALVFRSFQFQFFCQRCFFFHSMFHSCYVDTLFVKGITQQVIGFLS